MTSIIVNKIADQLKKGNWDPDILVMLGAIRPDITLVQMGCGPIATKPIFDFVTPVVDMVIGLWLQDVKQDLLANGTIDANLQLRKENP